VQKTARGVVTSYLTSITGERFHKTELHFSKSDPTNVAPAIRVDVDQSKKAQKILGFGGAFTDAAGINIHKLPNDMQSRLVKDYFGSDGIEYSIGRIPIGGSDFSTRPYSYDDNINDEPLSKFALQSEDLDFKIPYLVMAQEVSPHKLKYFGSPWSSPAWMKTNHEINHGGTLIGQPGGKYYKIFAKYFVRFLQEYEKHKVNVWGITIENEPGAGFDPNWKWNALGLNQTLERDFIKMDLGPELQAAGFTKDKLKVMIFDDQLPYIRNWVNTVLQDADARKYISGVAYHWYENNKANWNDLDWLNQQYPEQFLLATEACEEWHGKSHHVSLGNWATVNRYSEDIIKDLNHYTTGWTDWNLVLDLDGGPNWVGNLVDAPIIVNASSHEYYKQPFFYAMGHFSKFLVPDSVKVHQDVHTTDNNLLVTVFQRPDQGTVLTILNKNNHAVVLQVHDPAQGYVDVDVKANSLETLVWY